MPWFTRGCAAVLFVLLAPCAAAQARAPTTGQIDDIARDVGRLESLRAIKNLQRSYAQYAQFGLWSEMTEVRRSVAGATW